MAKKQHVEQDAEAAEKDAPQYRYRFNHGLGEFAVRQDGHTIALRYGAIVPEAKVCPKAYRHRKGIVTALLPGWGPPPLMVIAVVEFELPVTIKDPEVLKPKRPVRLWPADELEVIP